MGKQQKKNSCLDHKAVTSGKEYLHATIGVKEKRGNEEPSSLLTIVVVTRERGTFTSLSTKVAAIEGEDLSTRLQ